MYRILNRLPGSLKNMLKTFFLQRRHVGFVGMPSFSGSWPRIRNEGTLSMGKHCSFRSFRLRPNITVRNGATLKIGDNAFINDGVNICATLSISIGRYAKIGDMTYIYDTDFHETYPGSGIKQAPVCIGNNVWIGANSMLLAGAVIGDHSVIAAGSVVTGEIPAGCLAAGTPARPIKTLDVPEGWIRE